MVLLLGGCAGKQLAQPENTSAGYMVRDSQGYVVTLTHKPQHIVSLSIGTDEILVGLVPTERIAALTYLADDSGISNISEQAKQVPQKIKADAETIIALQPDLVIVPDWQPVELIQIMRDAGIAVYVYKGPNTIADIKKVIGELAHIVGEEAAGAQLIAQMDTELANIAEKIQHIPADQQPVVVRFTLLGGAGGSGSTFDDICHYAGVKNGAAIAGLGMNGVLSKEQIVKVDPDILLLPTWDYTGKTDLQQFEKDLQDDPAFSSVKAIREQRLIRVLDRHLYCSSQYIVYGVREVASAAYPQYITPE
jgi:iron complex transport system substrate-binding protein